VDGSTLAEMARRADPERIFQARRAAVRNGLSDTGMSREDAERWCDAWEVEAAGRGLPIAATTGKLARNGSPRNGTAVDFNAV